MSQRTWFVTDITERKQIEERLAALHRQLLTVPNHKGIVSLIASQKRREL